MKIKTLVALFVLGVSIIALVFALSFYYVATNINTLHDKWDVFESRRSQKTMALMDLHRHLGYGGVVHNLKNYVLRSDEQYRTDFYSNIGALSSVLARYRSFRRNPEEDKALKIIAIALEDYEVIVERIKQQIDNGVSVITLDQLAERDNDDLINALKVLHQNHINSLYLKDLSLNKAEILSSVISHFGLGGLIDYFKDYVLLHDGYSREKTEESYQAIHKQIDRYLEIGVTQQETDALTQLKQVADQYFNMLPIVVEMAGRNADVLEIDKRVKVNDTAAFTAIENLTYFLAQQTLRDAQNIDESFNRIQSNLMRDGLLLGLMMLALVVAGMWFTSSMIIIPIMRLKGYMDLLAAGKTKLDIQNTSLAAEIGDMSRAVEVFRQNIIERDTAVSNLKDRESRVSAIVNTAHECIVTINSKGVIDTFNPASERIFGYPAKEVIGLNVSTLMSEPFRSAHNHYLENYLTTGEARIIGTGRELTGLRANGSEFPMELAVSEMDVGGERMFTGIIRDISERKKAQSALNVALKKAEDRAVQLQTAVNELSKSNHDLDQYAYIASHDLKSPLQSISQLASWVEEDCATLLPDESKQHLLLMRQRIKRMENLLADLLAYSRVGNLDYEAEWVDLAALARSIFEFYSVDDKFSLNLKTGNSRVYLPRIPLELVLRNLLGNARKHHDQDSGEITVSYREGNGVHIISVTDDGPGIPPELHGKALKMFHTLQPRDKVEGSGMGLALVTKTLEYAGGELNIISEGRGTCIETRWKNINLLDQPERMKQA